MQCSGMRKVLMGEVSGVILVLALSLLLTSPATASPSTQPPFPEGESQYFYQTGYYVEGPFLEFYRTRGGERNFGYPQTRRFFDSEAGLWMQYFDNVRMEWHPDNPDQYKVQLGLLGEILGHRHAPIPSSQIPHGHPFRRYFPQTGHVVSFAFLVFYDQGGGLDIFGYPISEPLVENGRIVQYFQRARMEWHPERPEDERVVLGALGLAYIQRFGVPEGVRELHSDAQYVSEEGPIQVWAFVRNVITGREGNQTIYVYVTDAARQPKSGAMATVAVRYPSKMTVFTAGPTDSRGITSVTFPIDSPPPGQKVVVDVTVKVAGQEQTAQTFFVPWY